MRECVCVSVYVYILHTQAYTHKGIYIVLFLSLFFVFVFCFVKVRVTHRLDMINPNLREPAATLGSEKGLSNHYATYFLEGLQLPPPPAQLPKCRRVLDRLQGQNWATVALHWSYRSLVPS